MTTMMRLPYLLILFAVGDALQQFPWTDDDECHVDTEWEASLFQQAKESQMCIDSRLRQRELWCAARHEAIDANRSVPVGRKRVVWFHLHNYGGTTICNYAAKNGEITTNENCNWPSDSCSEQKFRTHCKERASGVPLNRSGSKGRSITFSMTERDIEHDDFCPEALTGTMLRDPLAAMASTLRKNHYDKAVVLQMLRTEKVTNASHQSCLPEWDTYQHFDNFATRTLSGAYNVPPGGVTAQHLKIAKERLTKLDVLVTLEELQDHMCQLKSSFAWNPALMNVSDHTTPKVRLIFFTEQEEAFLKIANKHDMELYEFGRMLAKQRTARHIAKDGSCL